MPCPDARCTWYLRTSSKRQLVWRDAIHHPHVHCIVPGGGVSPEGARWVPSRSNFFLSVRVLSRQRILLARIGDLPGQLLVAERRPKEETQAAHDRDERVGLETALEKMQAVASHVLGRELVRALPVVLGEVRHGTDVDVSGNLRHFADLHVVDHALPQ